LQIFENFPKLKILDLSYIGNVVREKGIPRDYEDYIAKTKIEEIFLKGVDINV
jgi:hypothetical protein